MDNKKEKPNLLHITATALITTIISMAVSVGIQWLSLESAVVTVSPSSELDGKYLTVISVQNLQEATLSNLSLYFDTDFDVLNIKSCDDFKHQQQYVELERVSPKAKYSVMVWTEQPISKGQIIAESDYKTRLDYSNDSSPFMLHRFWYIIPFALITFLATGIQIWANWKHRIKDTQIIREESNKLTEEIERKKLEIKALEAKQKSIDEEITKVKEFSAQKSSEFMRELRELRSIYSANISQLRKELSFWRDTVRKLLYNSQNEFQAADKVIETVISTLKTYTTRKHSDENMDELLYLAQLIADSRELHSERDSSVFKKD